MHSSIFVGIPARGRGRKGHPQQVKTLALSLALNPELSIADIAESLGIPRTTVATWIHAARTKMADAPTGSAPATEQKRSGGSDVTPDEGGTREQETTTHE
jgi:transposase-like protein